MEDLLGIFIGIGLSAACGFRIFVPLLGISIASMTGHVELMSGFEWIGSPLATTAFAVATILEVAAYYIPAVDNFMDTIESPAAIVAGTIITASVIGDIHPFLRWSLALIAGGGTAGIVQGGTALIRATSLVTTGGGGNPIISTVELASSAFATIFALIFPFAAAIIAILLVIYISKKLIRFFLKKKKGNIDTPVISEAEKNEAEEAEIDY